MPIYQKAAENQLYQILSRPVSRPSLQYLPSHDATLSASYHPSLRPSYRDSGYYVYCIDETEPTDISIGVAVPDEVTTAVPWAMASSTGSPKPS